MAKALETGVTYVRRRAGPLRAAVRVRHPRRRSTSRRCAACYVGGSAATPTLFGRSAATFPNAELVHGYGSTESGPHTLALRGQAFLDHFGSLGLPVPAPRSAWSSREGGDAGPDGEVGELWVRSDAVMAGYSRAARPDRGRVRRRRLAAAPATSSGGTRRLLLLADRAKDMIISGGENVYPREVEDTSRLPGRSPRSP